MKGIVKFVRTSLVGGILFMLPIVLMAIIIGKALAIADKIVGPLTAHLPEDSVFGLDMPRLLAIAMLVLFSGRRICPDRTGAKRHQLAGDDGAPQPARI